MAEMRSDPDQMGREESSSKEAAIHKKRRRGKKRQHSDVSSHKKKANFFNRPFTRTDKSPIRTRRYSTVAAATARSKHRVRFSADTINRAQGYSLRPANVPKAPENSTQFLIDDHEECKLYKSFEVDFNPNDSGGGLGLSELYGELDMQESYFVNDFEHSYHIAKEEYLSELKKEHLIAEIKALERKLKDLESVMEEKKSEKLLLNLQVKLVRLQEQNQMLKHENLYLRGCFKASVQQGPPEEEVVNGRPGSSSSSPSSSDDESCSTCNSSTSSSISDCGSSCSECEREKGQVNGTDGEKVVNGYGTEVIENGNASPPNSQKEENHEGEALSDVMVHEVSSSKNA